MRRVLFIVSLFCVTLAGRAQELSVDELLTLTSLSQQKFDQYISKKGFSRSSGGFQHDSIPSTYQPKRKKKQKQDESEDANFGITRSVERIQDGRSHTVVFRTSSTKEFESLREKIKKDGFTTKDTVPHATNVVFQKKQTTIRVTTAFHTEDTQYVFQFHRKDPLNIPKITYAEELLQFASHDDLENAFGEANVKKDMYFFTDREITGCSVLFPNTSRQAVFIWKNDSSHSELSSVVFGGSLRTNGDITYSSQTAENTWILANGIHSNMSARELLQLNGGEDMEFFGKQSNFYLSVVPENKGEVDLKGLTVMLGCMNCDYANTAVLNNERVSVKEAIQNGLGLFVIMVMLSPEANTSLEKTSR